MFTLDCLRVLLAYVMLLGVDVPLVGRYDNGNLICLTRQPVNAPHPAIRTESGVAKKGGILLANLFQGSSSTFSGARFPAFLAFKEGMWDTHIAALLGSPTVSPAKEAGLLPPPRLRTVRETFASHGSSME
jgi:hypothetical protein